MSKSRVYSHEKRTSEKWKHFPFFFYLFAHSFLVFGFILLKYFKICWKTPPIERSHRNQYDSRAKLATVR